MRTAFSSLVATRMRRWFLFGFMLFAIGFVGWHFSHSATPPVTKRSEVTAAVLDTANKLNELLNSKDKPSVDSDTDGLMDWEETIIGTDPKNPDTDGDGTTDGAEILAGRDALKPGPNDLTIAATASAAPSGTGAANAPTPDEKNMTYALSNSLLQSGVLSAIGQDGAITSTDFLNNLSLPGGLDGDSLFKDIVPLSAKDLTLIQKDDAETVRTYFLAAGQLYKKNLGSFTKSDIGLFTQALESQNYDPLAQLQDQALALEKTADAVRNLPTPASYADVAIREIQNLRKIATIMRALENVEQDPLQALVAFRARLDLFQSMAQSSAALAEELKQKGILSVPQQ